MKKLVWQKFILGLGNLDEALSLGLGGVIFFAKDIKSEPELLNKIKDIKSKSLVPPFISIDQEGGRVERTEAIRPRRLSAKQAYAQGRDFLKNQSEEISEELSNWGFNLNFAPCIDVNTNRLNPIIGERSFGNTASEVIDGSKVFIEASRKYKIIPCVKHYPGHGDADKDSHLTLPQIKLDFKEMDSTHIKPFKFWVDNNIEMIMAAHLHCRCFDENPLPTSLSKNAIGYLRKDLNYDGVIVSDDMVMKGVQDYGNLEAVIMGIEAGLDMFIFRDSDNKTLEMIEKLCNVVANDRILIQKVLESQARIEKLKRAYNIIK